MIWHYRVHFTLWFPRHCLSLAMQWHVRSIQTTQKALINLPIGWKLLGYFQRECKRWKRRSPWRRTWQCWAVETTQNKSIVRTNRFQEHGRLARAQAFNWTCWWLAVSRQGFLLETCFGCALLVSTQKSCWNCMESDDYWYGNVIDHPSLHSANSAHSLVQSRRRLVPWPFWSEGMLPFQDCLISLIGTHRSVHTVPTIVYSFHMLVFIADPVPFTSI